MRSAIPVAPPTSASPRASRGAWDRRRESVKKPCDHEKLPRSEQDQAYIHPSRTRARRGSHGVERTPPRSTSSSCSTNIRCTAVTRRREAAKCQGGMTSHDQQRQIAARAPRISRPVGDSVQPAHAAASEFTEAQPERPAPTNPPLNALRLRASTLTLTLTVGSHAFGQGRQGRRAVLPPPTRRPPTARRPPSGAGSHPAHRSRRRRLDAEARRERRVRDRALDLPVLVAGCVCNASAAFHNTRLSA